MLGAPFFHCAGLRWSAQVVDLQRPQKSPWKHRPIRSQARREVRVPNLEIALRSVACALVKFVSREIFLSRIGRIMPDYPGLPRTRADARPDTQEISRIKADKAGLARTNELRLNCARAMRRWGVTLRARRHFGIMTGLQRSASPALPGGEFVFIREIRASKKYLS
jgi:hypothetical protein